MDVYRQVCQKAFKLVCILLCTQIPAKVRQDGLQLKQFQQQKTYLCIWFWTDFHTESELKSIQANGNGITHRYQLDYKFIFSEYPAEPEICKMSKCEQKAGLFTPSVLSRIVQPIISVTWGQYHIKLLKAAVIDLKAFPFIAYPLKCLF